LPMTDGRSELWVDHSHSDRGAWRQNCEPILADLSERRL